MARKTERKRRDVNPSCGICEGTGCTPLPERAVCPCVYVYNFEMFMFLIEISKRNQGSIADLLLIAKRALCQLDRIGYYADNPELGLWPWFVENCLNHPLSKIKRRYEKRFHPRRARAFSRFLFDVQVIVGRAYMEYEETWALRKSTENGRKTRLTRTAEYEALFERGREVLLKGGK